MWMGYFLMSLLVLSENQSNLFKNQPRTKEPAFSQTLPTTYVKIYIRNIYIL